MIDAAFQADVDITHLGDLAGGAAVTVDIADVAAFDNDVGIALVLAVAAVTHAKDIADVVFVANVDDDVGVAILQGTGIAAEGAQDHGIGFQVALFKGNEIGALAQG